MIDLADRRALSAWNPASPETITEAVRLKDAALLDFGMTQSPIAGWVYARCRHQVATKAADTACVADSGDGTCLELAELMRRTEDRAARASYPAVR